MAAKLVKYFELIEAHGGQNAKMRLIMATGVAAMIAAKVEDSPMFLAKFKEAFKEITGKDAPPV